MTLYGITTYCIRLPNPCRFAELQDYPVPLLLDYDSCVRYIAKYYPDDAVFNPRVESEQKCWQLVKHMVEMNAGRRTISGGNMIVTDESRPTYDQLFEWSNGGRYSGTPWKDRNGERASLYRESIRKALEPTFNRKPARPPMIRRDSQDAQQH